MNKNKEKINEKIKLKTSCNAKKFVIKYSML